MLNVTQRLKTNATSNINRAYKILNYHMVYASMQLRDKYSYKKTST